MNPREQMVTDDAGVSEIAEEIRQVGELFFDLEFVSEARFIPELALLQASWGDPDDPEVAIIDCVAADPAPIFELIATPEVTVIAHAATQDLGLLATRFDVGATQFIDTQIAAAFVGVGDQIGYGNLVKAIIAVELDKGAQFTDWLKRPLSDKQLRYALNDVLFLPRVWRELRDRLEGRGRLSWVLQESAELAASMTGLPPSELAYRSIKGWKALDGRQLGALRALAAWRQETALAKNKPLGWVLPDKAMVDLCRKRIKSPRDLTSIRGIGEGTVRRYGEAIVAAARRGADQPIEGGRRERGAGLSPRGQVLAAVAASIIGARCTEAGIAPRFAGTRADAEALVAWFEEGAAEPCELPLLTGWRRDMVGDDLLAWLRGDKALVVGDEDTPLLLRDV